jgi:hypothetical protein
VLKYYHHQAAYPDRRFPCFLSVPPGKICDSTLQSLRVERGFENRVLRGMFGPKRDEVTREGRELHNEELQNLYSSPNFIRQMKSKGMRCAGQVARIGEKSVQGFGGKARKKETSRKTEA